MQNVCLAGNLDVQGGPLDMPLGKQEASNKNKSGMNNPGTILKLDAILQLFRDERIGLGQGGLFDIF